MVLLVLGLTACSGRSAGVSDATPDLPPKSEWTPCPEDFWSVFNKNVPCVGANSCLNYYCGNMCECVGGVWDCQHWECYPPDLGVDVSPDLDPDAALLGQGDACDPADDRCASGLKCCVTGGGPPWIFDAAPPWPYTCITPLSDGTCPPPPP